MDSPQIIRILDVLPGQYDDNIKCVIRSVPLWSHGQYEALSYVWGDIRNPKEIQVSSQKVNVTVALFEILKRLRYETEIRALWIDQLCIKQWDQDDKVQQIRLMRDIFSRCMRCIIWVGEVDHSGQNTFRDAEAALDFISLCAGHPRWSLTLPGPSIQGSMYHGSGSSIPSSLSSPEKVAGAVQAFESFTTKCSIWWSRVWTVPEVVLPEKALVQWGTLSLPWSIITKAASNLSNPGTNLPSLSLLQAFDGLLDDFVGPIRGLSKAKEGEVPLNIFQRWRYRQATDPRDKVYALMGLFQQETLPNVQLYDYRLSILALYPKITADLIHLEGGLRPLAGLRGRYTPGLATWAIDLAGSPDLETWRWWWNHSHRYKWFKSDNDGSLSADFLHDDTTLSLTGVLVDTVEEVGSVLTVHRGQTPSNTDIIRTMQLWQQLTDIYMSQGHSSDCPYDNWDVAFWKTMIGDLIVHEYPRRRATVHDAKLVMLYYQNKTWSEAVQSLKSMVINKSFFITGQGYIGLGPPDLEKGDHVWVLSGGSVPFILRQSHPSADMQAGNQGLLTCTLIGDAYVHGIMDGEAVSLYGNRRHVV